MRFTGDVAKSFSARNQAGQSVDPARSMQYMGEARKLVGMLVERINGPGLNGYGSMSDRRFMADGTLIRAYVRMIPGTLPIIRTWIESPTRGAKHELFTPLVYALLNRDERLIEVYRITVHPIRGEELEGGVPFYIYDNNTSIGHSFTSTFSHTTAEHDPRLVGGNWWIGINPVTKKEQVVSCADNYIFVDGHVLHKVEEGLTIAAAAIDYSRKTELMDSPALIGQRDGVLNWWDATGTAAPALLRFSPDAQWLSVFNVSFLLNRAYRVPPSPREESNGFATFLNLKKKSEDKKNIRATTVIPEYIGATALIIKEHADFVVSPVITIATGLFTYRLFCNAPFISVYDATYYKTQHIDIKYEYSITWTDGHLTECFLQLSFTLDGLEHVQRYCNYTADGDGLYTGERTTSTFQISLDYDLSCLHLGTVNETLSSGESTIEHDRELRVYSGGNLVGSIPSAAPNAYADYMNPITGNKFEGAVYAPDSEDRDVVIDNVWRPFIERLFNLPIFSTWEQTLSPRLPHVYNYMYGEDGEDGEAECFVIAPYNDEHVIVTNLGGRKIILETNSYTFGLLTENDVTYETIHAKQ